MLCPIQLRKHLNILVLLSQSDLSQQPKQSETKCIRTAFIGLRTRDLNTRGKRTINETITSSEDRGARLTAQLCIADHRYNCMEIFLYIERTSDL